MIIAVMMLYFALQYIGCRRSILFVQGINNIDYPQAQYLSYNSQYLFKLLIASMFVVPEVIKLMFLTRNLFPFLSSYWHALVLSKTRSSSNALRLEQSKTMSSGHALRLEKPHIYHKWQVHSFTSPGTHFPGHSQISHTQLYFRYSPAITEMIAYYIDIKRKSAIKAMFRPIQQYPNVHWAPGIFPRFHIL